MAISEEQLKIWATAPSSTKSKYTHEQVRDALNNYEALKQIDYEVFLQGSYANSTNTKIDSDIDIVVQLNDTFAFNASEFHQTRIDIFRNVHPAPSYNWNDFKRDVTTALNNHFGSACVISDNKCIKLVKNDQRVNADIIPCLQYRNYRTFDHNNYDDFVEGMKFWTKSGVEIINYPKLHLSNGEDKNASHRTDQKYKHLVRIIKNIRRKLIENGIIDKNIAKSYFVECAIYNVPDNYFSSSYQSTLSNVLQFILHECNPQSMTTGSHQHLLFGQNPWQWNTNNASTFFTAVKNYYQNN